MTDFFLGPPLHGFLPCHPFFSASILVYALALPALTSSEISGLERMARRHSFSSSCIKQNCRLQGYLCCVIIWEPFLQLTWHLGGTWKTSFLLKGPPVSCHGWRVGTIFWVAIFLRTIFWVPFFWVAPGPAKKAAARLPRTVRVLKRSESSTSAGCLRRRESLGGGGHEPWGVLDQKKIRERTRWTHRVTMAFVFFVFSALVVHLQVIFHALEVICECPQAGLK